MGKEIEEFQPIFGEAKPEWQSPSPSSPLTNSKNENEMPKLNPFIYRVFSSDPSHLTFHVTDFRSYTWESRLSFHNLDDLRDSIGIGGSWSDFMNYVIASLKSEDVKLFMKWQPESNDAVSAKLVCRKSKGMPLLSVSLSKVGHSTATEAMANLSLELFKAYSLMQVSLAREQERSCELAQVISTEKDKSQALKRKLDTTVQLDKQRLQKTMDIGSTISPLNFEGSSATAALNSFDKQPSEVQPAKVAHRVVPAYRRAKVRGVVLHDTEEEEGS